MPNATAGSTCASTSTTIAHTSSTGTDHHDIDSHTCIDPLMPKPPSAFPPAEMPNSSSANSVHSASTATGSCHIRFTSQPSYRGRMAPIRTETYTVVSRAASTHSQIPSVASPALNADSSSCWPMPIASAPASTPPRWASTTSTGAMLSTQTIAIGMAMAASACTIPTIAKINASGTNTTAIAVTYVATSRATRGAAESARAAARKTDSPARARWPASRPAHAASVRRSVPHSTRRMPALEMTIVAPSPSSRTENSRVNTNTTSVATRPTASEWTRRSHHADSGARRSARLAHHATSSMTPAVSSNGNVQTAPSPATETKSASMSARTRSSPPRMSPSSTKYICSRAPAGSRPVGASMSLAAPAASTTAPRSGTPATNTPAMAMPAVASALSSERDVNSAEAGPGAAGCCPARAYPAPGYDAGPGWPGAGGCGAACGAGGTCHAGSPAGGAACGACAACHAGSPAGGAACGCGVASGGTGAPPGVCAVDAGAAAAACAGVCGSGGTTGGCCSCALAPSCGSWDMVSPSWCWPIPV